MFHFILISFVEHSKINFDFLKVRVPLMVKIDKKYFFSDVTIHAPIESPS
jgi:hypothetical protein